MLPTLISVSVAPTSYFFCAAAGPMPIAKPNRTHATPTHFRTIPTSPATLDSRQPESQSMFWKRLESSLAYPVGRHERQDSRGFWREYRLLG